MSMSHSSTGSPPRVSHDVLIEKILAQIGEPIEIGAGERQPRPAGQLNDPTTQLLAARESEAGRLLVDAGEVLLGHVADAHIGHR